MSKNKKPDIDHEAIYKLYKLSKGLGRVSAATMVSAIKSLGQDDKVRLVRVNRGYSTRVGAQSKLSDDVYIEYRGWKFGSRHKSMSSFANFSLEELAADVVSHMSDDQRNFLERRFLCDQLQQTGVSSALLAPIRRTLEWR